MTANFQRVLLQSMAPELAQGLWAAVCSTTVRWLRLV